MSDPTVTAATPVMTLKVYSPYQVYFDGNTCTSVSAVNQTGPFDILPRHHNFITLLVACELIIRTVSDSRRIRIDRGLMHVKADNVTVFLDI